MKISTVINFKFKRPEDSSGFLLWQLTNQWQRQQRQALAKLDLTHAQFVVLAAVLWLNEHSDESVTQQKVSTFTHIDKMSMSDLTAILIRKKLLRRKNHSEDKRAYSLVLTERGQQRVLMAIPVVEGIDADFFTQETSNLLLLLNSLKHLL